MGDTTSNGTMHKTGEGASLLPPTVAADDGGSWAATADGRRFRLPETPSMLVQLFSPTTRKNWADLVILVVLALHVGLFFVVAPEGSSGHYPRIIVFGSLFAFWRTMYNGGIGWLLRRQSCDQAIVRWAARSGIFKTPAKAGEGHDEAAEAEARHPRLRSFVKGQLEITMRRSSIPYDFDNTRIEFNTWLVFRRLADLVLMCDFVSYFFFAVACGLDASSFSLADYLPPLPIRWTLGLIMFAINIWAKADAHRVCKDTNWYWGDFFFVPQDELIFDGIFRLTNNPMYTIGYLGYYGMTLITGSWLVLAASVAAHAAQLVFLYVVEEPHFKKTYAA